MASDYFFVPEPSVESEYLIRNIEPPLDGQIDAIENEMAVYVDALSNLNSRIGQFEESLDLLYDLRDTTTATLSSYQSVLNPSRRIPNEVLADIFLCSVNPNITTDSYGRFTLTGSATSPNVDDLPFTLLGVCQRWRNIAFSLLQLWLIIDIHLKGGESWSRASMDVPLTRCLQFSQNLPLTISLLCSAPLEKHHPIISFLTKSAPRWKDVLLYVNPEILPHLNPIRNKLNSLERLYLKQAVEVPFFPASDERLFTSAPKLVQFSAGLNMSTRFILPWSQITNISPEMEINDHFIESVLPLLTSLRHAEFTLRDSGGTPGLFRQIVMPSMTHLSLMTLFKPALSNFFMSIICPRLHSLELKANLAPEPFVGFVERSLRMNGAGQGIQILKLDRLTMTPTSLVRLLPPFALPPVALTCPLFWIVRRAVLGTDSDPER